MHYYSFLYCHGRQSDVPLDIQEIDKSSAVVSYTPPSTEVWLLCRR